MSVNPLSSVNNGVSKIDAPKKAKKIHIEAKIISFIKEGVQNGQSMQYVIDRAYKLIQDHPNEALAQGFLDHYQQFKTIIEDTFERIKHGPSFEGGNIRLGKWDQVGSQRIFNAWCSATWLWDNVQDSIWSGNPNSPFLPHTRGTMIYNGGGGLKRGDKCSAPNPTKKIIHDGTKV